MRKYISLMDPRKRGFTNQLPFNAWDCITLQIKGQSDVYLVIKNEKIMTMLLKFLIHHLKTFNGVRNSASKLIDVIARERMISDGVELSNL